MPHDLSFRISSLFISLVLCENNFHFGVKSLQLSGVFPHFSLQLLLLGELLSLDPQLVLLVPNHLESLLNGFSQGLSGLSKLLVFLVLPLNGTLLSDESSLLFCEGANEHWVQSLGFSRPLHSFLNDMESLVIFDVIGIFVLQNFGHLSSEYLSLVVEFLHGFRHFEWPWGS